ncbi:MAG: phage tail sheath subtilisin-like domain-containing protein, partial [Pseudomonadota bacterium]
MAEQYLHGIKTEERTNGRRPTRTAQSATIGIVGTAPNADNALWPMNEPIHIQTAVEAAGIGDTGTLSNQLDGLFDQRNGLDVVVVRVEEGADIDATLANVVGSASAQTGVHALKGAKAHLDIIPRLMAFPGFTSQRPGSAANPVVAEALSLADSMRAMIFADGPNTTRDAAVEYREDWGSSRLFITDPHVKVFRNGANVIEPVSGRVAGLTAKTDHDHGFWHSPSSKVINGIVGTARPISFYLNDPATEANYLNEREVATVIRDDGFRLFGNRTASADPQWAFMPVRRTADLIYDSIENAARWALDKPFSVQLLEDIGGQVNDYLRYLKAIGAILGGQAWLEPALNPPSILKQGKAFVSFDIEPQLLQRRGRLNIE